MKKALGTIQNFMVFFLLVAFVITCCITLFTSTLQETIGHNFTREEITAAARATMANVLLISGGMAIIDYLRRKITVERRVKRITEAANQMVAGDFSVRIRPTGRFLPDEGFNEIIDCVNLMAQELGSVETLRTDFISNVSHEMKTPLSVIQNYGTLLQAPDLSEEKRLEYAKGVTDASRRLSEMMTNILKLNRLENQQIFPETAEYDLGEQLCACLLQFESQWEEQRIEIETDIQEDVRIEADQELLSLIWNNLLSNAFKFTPEGGRVCLSLTATDTHATVKVSDTGCGMTPEVGAHIFEKFYQADSSRATQGNGLGLALVKRVVDILQAQIRVESAPEAGTTFTVTLRRN